jgi:hypothetical protein
MQLQLPAQFPARLPANPRPLLLVDVNAVSHRLTEGQEHARATNATVGSALETAQTAAPSFNSDHSQVFRAASTATARYHLDLITRSAKNAWAIRLIVATARATRDHKARVASATDEVSSIDEQAAAVQLQIVTLLEDRASHWKVLVTRCWELPAHFDRRGATYAGQASKGAAVRLAQTRVTRPQWLSQPAPPAPRPDDPTASPPNPH